MRPAVKEQVQSLGARFVEMPLETADAEDKGGYAKAQDESFYRRQREMMLKVVAGSDVVITTALIPGKKAPILVTDGDGRGDGAGIGRRRSRGRARRQLRADAARRGRRPQRRDDPRAVEPAGAGAVSRQPDVFEEHHHVPHAPARQGRREASRRSSSTWPTRSRARRC